MLSVSQAVLSVVLGAWSVRFVGWADWVGCMCFLSFVFLGVARRLELIPVTQRLPRRPEREGEREGAREGESGGMADVQKR